LELQQGQRSLVQPAKISLLSAFQRNSDNLISTSSS
jgi:hypothetical protein